MSACPMYLSPAAHQSPRMTRSKMNNNPLPLSQSVSVTSESSMSLSDLEEASIEGMAAIVLTDSDGEAETFSDPPDYFRSTNSHCAVPPLSQKSWPDSHVAGNSFSRSTARNLHGSPSPAPRCSTTTSSHPSPPVNQPPSSDKTRSGLRVRAAASLHGPPANAAPTCKQKFYVVLNGRTMGVFTRWDKVHKSTTKFTSFKQDTASPMLEDALERWNTTWMTDAIGFGHESGSMVRLLGSKGKGLDVLPTFYYIIVKGLVPHVVFFLEDAIEDAGKHPYCKVFVVRDKLYALQFLSDKLRDDEVLRADF